MSADNCWDSSAASRFELETKRASWTTAMDLLLRMPPITDHQPVVYTMLTSAANAGFIEGCKIIYNMHRREGQPYLINYWRVISICFRDAFLRGDHNLGRALFPSNITGVSDNSLPYICAVGDIDRFMESVAESEYLNAGDFYPCPPFVGFWKYSLLQVACLCGHLNIVKLLVEKYQMLDQKAFCFACASGRMDIITYLLDQQGVKLFDISLNIDLLLQLLFLHGEQPRNDPLMFACEYGRLEVVQLLLSSEAYHDPRQYTESGNYLSVVCSKGYHDIARFFLQQESQLTNAFLRHTKSLTRSGSRICCANMEENGIAILSYVSDSWDYDSQQLVDYDCVTPTVTNILLKKMCFTYTNAYSVTDQLYRRQDYQIFFANGFEFDSFSAFFDCHAYDDNYDVNLLEPINRVYRDLYSLTEYEHVWALLEMGVLDQHVDYLVDQEIFPEQLNCFLQQPIATACRRKDQVLIDRLLQLGATWNLKDFNMLFKEDEVDTMVIHAMLQMNNIDLNEPCLSNKTFLHYFCCKFDVDIVRLLLSSNEDIISMSVMPGEHPNHHVALRRIVSEMFMEYLFENKKHMKKQFLTILQLLVSSCGFDDLSAIVGEGWKESNDEDMQKLVDTFMRWTYNFEES